MSERLDRLLLLTADGVVLVEAFDRHLLAAAGELLDATHFMYTPSAVMQIIPVAKRVQDYLPLAEHETAIRQLVTAHRRIEMKV